MIKICSLSSGSCGNGFYLESGATKLLVDAGLPLSYLSSGLKSIGSGLPELTAVLITHEHSDHISAVEMLSRRFNVPVYANSPTIDAALNVFSRANLRVFPIDDYFRIGDFDILAFPTSHDSSASVGFCFYQGRLKIGIATDLGIVTDEVVESLAGFDALLLEANHDEEVLANGRYPFFLKKRIRGKLGHLSNREAAALLTKLVTGREQTVLLGHMSAENNTPELAYQTVSNELNKSGIDSISLLMAPRRKLSELVTVS